jgi:hypothetical protein
MMRLKRDKALKESVDTALTLIHAIWEASKGMVTYIGMNKWHYYKK